MILEDKKVFFIIYLGALAAFAPFSTDIYLASMPTIEHVFNTSVVNVQLTLSLFFISFAITQLLWGALSDRIGRKLVILIGVMIFILASLLCAWSTNILTLIIARILQAAGGCSGIIMAIAIVKDRFPESDKLSKALSVMTSITIVAPMIAPIIGSYLLHHIGWRANFYFLAIYGTMLIIATLLIKESYPKNLRKPLPVNKLYHSYVQQMKFNPFLLVVLAVSTNFSVFFAFISSSPFIYIRIYHLPAYLFGYLFAINAAALTCGSFTLYKIKNKLSDSSIIFMTTLLSATGAAMMIVLIYFFPGSIWCIIAPSFIVTYGVGILLPELTSQALKHVVAYTGLASSLLGTSRYILAAVTGYILGFIITNTAIPLAIIMLLLNAITAILMLFYCKYYNGRNDISKASKP